jgi:hypothetical protein
MWSYLATLLVESCYRPYPLQVKADLYKEFYQERADAYRNIMKMFSDIYSLERKLLAEPSEVTKENRRLDLVLNVQTEILRASPFISRSVYRAGFKAINGYIDNHQNFTPDVRNQWIKDFFDPLLLAIRADLGSNVIEKTMEKSIFQNREEKWIFWRVEAFTEKTHEATDPIN